MDIIALFDGTILETHAPEKCNGDTCCIHNPSDHRMKDWPQYWNGLTRMMYRKCKHNIPHPDPDELSYRYQHFGPFAAIQCALHMCDCRCCRTHANA